jgi:hypothetical protein
MGLRSQDVLIVFLVIEGSKERSMGNVMTVTCRSYSAQVFDGCPACVGAALEAVEQAGIYILGRTAPGMASQSSGPLEMAYRMKVRLFDDTGDELAADELATEQTIEVVYQDDETAETSSASWYSSGNEADTDDSDPATSMRLDDFQTVLARLELAPAGQAGVTGVMAGRLFGYERSIADFEIEVAPGH